MARRNAICIGINSYAGAPLAGCVNDADDWAHALGGLGFSVGVLDDAQATRAAIVAAVARTVASLRGPGDVAAITYSGHGTWVLDRDGDEPDGRDEAFCPHDLGPGGRNLLRDDDVRTLLAARPEGARVVLVTDCCHSGTIFRAVASPDAPAARVRFLPPAQFAADPGEARRYEQLARTPVARSDAPLPGVVHLAACRDTEYSYDTAFGGRPGGAFTHFALAALAALPARANYADWAAALATRLPSVSYPQSPRLNAAAGDAAAAVFT